MNQKLIDTLKAAVGDTAYGRYLIQDCINTETPQGEVKIEKDRLDEAIGILKAYEKLHEDADEEAKATAEAEKIAIAEKARQAIEGLED